MLRELEDAQASEEKKTARGEEEIVYTSQTLKIPDNEDSLNNNFKIEVSAFEKYTNKQTTFANDSIFAKVEKEEIVFAICIDGSAHSSYAFDLVTTQFFKPTSKLLVTHIFSNELDKYYNYQNKKDTVLYSYSARLIPFKENSNFVVENRESKIHALEQVLRIATNRECNYLFLGYWGIKGPKGSNEELSKGISFALSYATLPVIMVKELTSRKEKKTGGFRWCFIMDKQYANCVRTLRAFSELIDPEKDFVYGLTLLPPYINFDINKREFMDELKMRGIKNFEYVSEEYKKEPGKLILEKVNHELEPFDFVVIYNNSNKHRNDPTTNENVDIIKICASNICFVNNISN